MRAIIISDIHGDLMALNSIIDKIYKYHIDKLIILGDLCSYYDDSIDIARRLNNFTDMIEIVKGNCDTSYFIDKCEFELPITRNIKWNNHTVTITHGHIFNPYYLPKNCGDIFLSGHTHRKSLEKKDNIIVGNPGSIGRPRDGSASYILLTEDKISLYNMDDQLLNSIKI